MKARFTIDGSDALEKHLEETCARVIKGVAEIIPSERLDALLLGGGYGRGQGGVLKTELGDKPYNDLEFYVCLKGHELLNERKYSPAFHRLAEKLSPESDVEVEFKITSLKKLKKILPTMFSYDLACGHRSLAGNKSFLPTDAEKDSSKIPLCEATRLLMNRCSGLLFAKEHLQRKPFNGKDADFVGRNHAKVQLALGDVFLTAAGNYHWDCRERNLRLANFAQEPTFPSLNELQRHHAIGLEFKLHPQRASGSIEHFCENQRVLSDLSLKTWLWLESKRLGTVFASASNYALSDVDKCPETNSVHNLLINAKIFGTTILLEGKPLRYPRERLFHALALLLWEPTALIDPTFLQRLQRELNTNATTFADLVKAYEVLWKRFN